MAEPFSIICVSRQEWSAELPTNRQQIMLRAARRGHRVLFVESGGHLGRHFARLLRGPGRRSLARRLFGLERVADGVEVRKAITVMPWGQKFKTANRVNARLTRLLLGRLAGRVPSPRVLWLYDPCAYELAGGFGEALAVYDVVDDYPEQVGSNGRRKRFVASADGEAASRSGVVFATTNGLYERHRGHNSSTYLVRNGADFEHFSRPGSVAAAIRDLGGPVLGFAGNLTTEKVDFELLEGLADAMPECNVVLVGPAPPSARPLVERLANRANVNWLGPRAYDELPEYVAGFDVGLIPYQANAYTRNCSPLKVFEYLAAGKPVVAAGVRELEGMEPDVVTAEQPDAFVRAVHAALEDNSSNARKRRQALAAANTWDGRTARLLELIEGRLAG